ncbi:MAG: ROK family protein [Bacteroidales bacterium]|nr:ROK family protein [Bacteroidales bacterium]
MDQNLAIGADIGGSHISCAAVDIVSLRIIRETLVEKDVNNKAPADEIISVWGNALSESISKIPREKLRGIGFGMPGPFDYVKGISYIKGVDKYENLYGCNVKEEISKALNVAADFPIRFMNDVSSFAVGEALVGKAASYNRSMAVTLGTGLGSAFIKNRIPVVDGPEVPKLGCVYHLPYKDNIADDYFSTRWFVRSYNTLTGKEIEGVKELSEMAPTDQIAMNLFQEFGYNLGTFLTPFLVTFKADIIVIGGNISNSYNFFGPRFEKRLKQEACECRVALSDLKEDAALIGAAFLMDDRFWLDIQHALPLM